MNKDYKEGESVRLQILYHTNLGYRVSINGKDDGLLFNSEVFQELKDGDEVTGYIKKIHDDGKIDVSLKRQGFRNVIGGDVNKILHKLEENNGVLNLSDKSSPEQIKATLNMSKKAFKKAIGNLYRQKRINIQKDFIEIVRDE